MKSANLSICLLRVSIVKRLFCLDASWVKLPEPVRVRLSEALWRLMKDPLEAAERGQAKQIPQKACGKKPKSKNRNIDSPTSYEYIIYQSSC